MTYFTSCKYSRGIKMHTKVSRFGSFCFYLRRRPYLSDAARCKNRELPCFFVDFFPVDVALRSCLYLAAARNKTNRSKLTVRLFTPSRVERKRPSSNDSMLSNTAAMKNIGLQGRPSPATTGALSVDADVTAGSLGGDDEQRFCRGETLSAPPPTCPIKFNLPRDT